MKVKDIINVTALKKALGKEELLYFTVENQTIFWNKSGYFTGRISKYLFESEIAPKMYCKEVTELPQAIKNIFTTEVNTLLQLEYTGILFELDENKPKVTLYYSKSTNTRAFINEKFIDILPKNNRRIIYTAGELKPTYYYNNTLELVLMPMRIDNSNRVWKNLKYIGGLD